MAAATLVVSALSIMSLYLTSIDQHRLHLAEMARSQVSLIGAIAQFDQPVSDLGGAGAGQVSTLEKLAYAHREFGGFGETGEFVLAQRAGDQIEFVLSRRHAHSSTPQSIPFTGDWAEPMRNALAGKSGVTSGLDYRGVEVLAAHEPIPLLGLGLVAKIDHSEIRAPFVRASLVTITVALLVIFIASRLFISVSRPIQQTIDEQAETFQILAETAREGIVLADTRGIIKFVNPAAERLFGFRHDELIEQPLTRLMPEEHSKEHDKYMKNYLQTGQAKIIGIGRQLTAMRKDGTRFPIYLSIGDIKTSHARLFAGVIMDISEQQQLQREILEIPVAEQRRIGQDLHDGLGQQLTGLGLLAASLLNKASKPEHDLAAKLAQGLQDAIAQVRSLSRGLMPFEIDAAGLQVALENLVEEFRAHGRVAVKLDCQQAVVISDNSVALHVYRIAQEALNNAVKHAKASEVELALGIHGARGCMMVRDNGRGFNGERQKTEGLGLRIMQHRCSLIDGELYFKSSPERGTTVTCFFPIDQQAKGRP